MKHENVIMNANLVVNCKFYRLIVNLGQTTGNPCVKII